LAVARKRFRYRLHRQIPAEEPGATGVLAEHQAANVGVQPVSADDHVKRAWRRVLESYVAGGGYRGDRVTEQVLDAVAAGVVVHLAEVVAHDLDVAVGRGTGDLGDVDVCRSTDALAIQRQLR